MKRFLIALAVLAFTASTASAGLVDLGGNTFTMALSDLDDFILVENDAGSFSHDGDLSDGDADYDVTLSQPSTSPGFTTVQIGFQFDTGMYGYGDLTGYDTFTLGISNDNPTEGEWIDANLFINTGWVDPGYEEDLLYAENTWTWLQPGTTTWLTLDLTSTNYYSFYNWNGSSWDAEVTGSGDVTSMALLNHTTAIGINFGTNYGETEWQPGRIDDTTTYDLNAVPEPMSMVMLGCLGAGMFGARRFRRRKE